MGVWWSSSSPSAIDAQSKRAVYVAKFVPSFRALEVTWFKMKPGRTPLQLYPHMHTHMPIFYGARKTAAATTTANEAPMLT